MVSQAEYRLALSSLDRKTRICILYLEELNATKYAETLDIIQKLPLPTISVIIERLDKIEEQLKNFDRLLELSETATREYSKILREAKELAQFLKERRAEVEEQHRAELEGRHLRI